MRITLDHNVIIDMLNRAPNVKGLRSAIDSGTHQAWVVDIGASEMLAKGVAPDRYDLFEQLLRDAGLELLPRLTPIMIWDLTFWDRFIWASDEMLAQAEEVRRVLFGAAEALPVPPVEGTPEWGKAVNRICDVETFCCHLRSGNDVFVTSDRNFLKQTKLPKLLSLGAKRICTPEVL